MSGKISLWVRELRAPFFTATGAPMLLGSVMAWSLEGTFHWGYFAVAFLGALLLHGGTNVINDYFDHIGGTDKVNYEFVRPFTGGSRMLQDHLMTPRAVLTEALVLYGLAVLVGAYLVYAFGAVVLYLGMVGILSGFFYTAPPLRLAATGLGELIVGLNFGVLMTLGAYYVQTRSVAWEPVLASIPVALLIAAVLYVNKFQDYRADRATGKTNLVVRLGPRRAATGYALLMGFTYLALLAMAATGAVSPFSLLAFATLPIAIRAVRVALANYDDHLMLAPANSATVATHLMVGLLLTVGYGVDRIVQ